MDLLAHASSTNGDASASAPAPAPAAVVAGVAPSSQLPQAPECTVCKATQGLSSCGNCKVVSYCCHEHQLSHWDDHKAACNAVKHARKKMDREEQTLRNYNGSATVPANPLVTMVGVLWKVPAAQPYLKARVALMTALSKLDTKAAQKQALQLGQQTLHMSRYDQYRVQSYMPSMFLRLGENQECYDFVKWWYYAAQDCSNDFTPASPFLTMHGEDVFEPVFYGRLQHEVIRPDWNGILAVTLIKVRLLLDLYLINAALTDCSLADLDYELRDGFSSNIDIFGAIRLRVHRAKIEDQLITEKEVVMVMADQLVSQIVELYFKVKKDNEHFWCKMMEHPLNGDEKNFLSIDPDPCPCQECGWVADWVETPGAIDLILEVAMRDEKSCTARKAAQGCH